MVENNKYYTPEIEEFHIGFEYEESEYYEDINDYSPLFQSKILNRYFLGHDSLTALKDNQIRVKYLDKEDIKSLGWDFSSMAGNQDLASIHRIENSTQEQNAIWLVFRETIQIIDCREKIHRHLFHGKIKNKSEFKKLMKQLGI